MLWKVEKKAENNVIIQRHSLEHHFCLTDQIPLSMDSDEIWYRDSYCFGQVTEE